MKRNFLLINAISLLFHGKEWDVHNDFDLESLVARPDSKSICISFRPSLGSGKKLPRRIALRFSGVTQAILSQEFLSSLPNGISEMGFKQPNDLDLDWLMSDAQAGSEDDFVVRFDNDEYFRIGCSDAAMEVED